MGNLLHHSDTPDLQITSVHGRKNSAKKIKITMKELYTEIKSSKVSKIQVQKKEQNSTENSELQMDKSKIIESSNITESSNSTIQIIDVRTMDYQCKICSNNFLNFEELAEHVEEKHYNL